MKIGEIVDSLIRIKDAHKNDLIRSEIESINDACNILYHSFNSSEEAYDIIEAHRK